MFTKCKHYLSVSKLLAKSKMEMRQKRKCQTTAHLKEPVGLDIKRLEILHMTFEGNNLILATLDSKAAGVIIVSSRQSSWEERPE